MLVILIKIDLHLIKVARIFLFCKRNRKLVPLALLSYISTREFLRTLEKCEKDSPTARVSLSTSRVFLKIPKCLYNSRMHSARFLFL